MWKFVDYNFGGYAKDLMQVGKKSTSKAPCSNKTNEPANSEMIANINDEIDIEEHDVMENPVIKTLFPDSSIVKLEIPDDYADMSLKVGEIFNGAEAEHMSADDHIDSEGTYEVINPASEEVEMFVLNANGSEAINIDLYIPDKKILNTPSKTVVISEEAELQFYKRRAIDVKAIIPLLDCGSYLNKSEKFCKICAILFPELKTYYRHKRVVHSRSDYGNRQLAEYRCCTCLKVFRKMKLYLTHKRNCQRELNKYMFPNGMKSQFDILSKTGKTNTSNINICRHCENLFEDKTSLIEHLYEVLQSVTSCETCHRNYESRDDMTEIQERTLNMRNTSEPTEHNTNLSIVRCDSYFSGNGNQSSEYVANSDIVGDINCVDASEPIQEEVEVWSSVFFKCKICKIHFVTSKEAMDHSMHKSIHTNWQCLVCKRSFKENNKLLHLRQHTFTKYFKVYEVSGDMADKILFNCSKCKVYFSEEQYINHYLNCNELISNAAYCNECNVLVYEGDMVYHEEKHENNRPEHFIFIKTDLYNRMENNKVNDNVCYPIRRVAMMYCRSCQCFMSMQAKNTEQHLLRLCLRNLKQRVCTICGVLLRIHTMKSHKKIHKRHDSLTLQSYTFFDITNTNDPICPPIPKYPYCEQCDVHCISMKNHNCEISPVYLTCDVCGLQFTKAAFKLHKPFHSYSIDKIEARKCVSPIEYVENNEDITDSFGCPSKTVDKPANINMFYNIIYVCRNCEVALNDYDAVVEHCQNHYKYENEEIGELSTCTVCNLKLLSTNYQKHQYLHEIFDKESIKIVNFDIFYFTSSNDIWIKHVFKTLPQELTEEILSKSIYKNARILMEVVQGGLPDLTVFKCNECQYYIDCNSLYKHAENSCFKIRPHLCTYCGIPFTSAFSRLIHEKIHKNQDVTPASYRVVLFNRRCDKRFNSSVFSKNVFVLYQCRGCETVVDQCHLNRHVCDLSILKHCTHCGLLVQYKDYEGHSAKHKEISKFIPENIKVILFGDKDERVYVNDGYRIPKSTFDGIIIDLTVYKCLDCEICLEKFENQSKHVCSSGISRVECLKCKVYVNCMDKKQHLTLHEANPELSMEHLRVITFKPSAVLTETEIHEEPLIESEEFTKCDQEKALIAVDQNSTEFKPDKLYKCPYCQVHFLDVVSIDSHQSNCSPRNNSPKKHCPYCDLLFLPKDFLIHVLRHHDNAKTSGYIFDIVEKSCINSVLYECTKCNFHFHNISLAQEHIEDCEDNRYKLEVCRFCNLNFDTTNFQYHTLDHKIKGYHRIEYKIFNVASS